MLTKIDTRGGGEFNITNSYKQSDDVVIVIPRMINIKFEEDLIKI